MTPISPGVLIALYLAGWFAALYIGMRISDKLWRNYQYTKIHEAYRRGWNHGFGFLQRISDIRTERDSSVKIKDPIT